MHDDTAAYFRRWVFINFPRKFEGDEADTDLINKITTKEELSGLLNFALIGLKRILKTNAFSNSTSTEETRDLYERLSDPIMAFIKDTIEYDSEATITKEELYNAYLDYVRENNLPALDKPVFNKKLLSRAEQTISSVRIGGKGDRQTAWRGLRIKLEGESEDDVEQNPKVKKILDDFAW